MAFSNSVKDADFFVESDEPSRAHFNIRDNAKMIARQRQDMIANEMSRITSEDYLEDIMQHVRHMEVRNKPGGVGCIALVLILT